MAAPSPNTVSVDEARALVQATTFDIFNEHDQSKRRQLMEKYWVVDVTCYSPYGVATGYDALDQVWGGEYFSFLALLSKQPALFAGSAHLIATTSRKPQLLQWLTRRLFRTPR